MASLYGVGMKPGCIGKSHTNNLPAPTNLTENPYEEIFFLKMQLKNRQASQRSLNPVRYRSHHCLVAIGKFWPSLKRDCFVNGFMVFLVLTPHGLTK